MRTARQLRAVSAVCFLLVLCLPWLALPYESAWRHRVASLGWRILLRGFGVRIDLRGTINPAARLFAANHVSWLDIAVLAQLLDAGFVAKAQVADWPIIGTLARRYGCAFIARERRGNVIGQTKAVADQIADNRPMILFPEGTTGCGNRLLPFRSSLFAALDGTGGGLVQPVALAYRDRAGRALSPAALRRVAWLDDDALLPHALALAASGGVTVEVTFEPALAPGCRKAIARHCEQAIAARLAGSDQAAAEANRAA